MPTVKSSERDWEAEEDFRTLTRAEEVKGDNKRLERAVRAGKRIVTQEVKALRTKQRVAKTGGRKPRR